MVKSSSPFFDHLLQQNFVGWQEYRVSICGYFLIFGRCLRIQPTGLVLLNGSRQVYDDGVMISFVNFSLIAVMLARSLEEWTYTPCNTFTRSCAKRWIFSSKEQKTRENVQHVQYVLGTTFSTENYRVADLIEHSNSTNHTSKSSFALYLGTVGFKAGFLKRGWVSI